MELGHIGLPIAAAFASLQKQVIGIDINLDVVEILTSWSKIALQNGYLRAYKIPQSADTFLIAVPTPFKDEYHPDITHMRAAANSIAAVLKKGDR